MRRGDSDHRFARRPMVRPFPDVVILPRPRRFVLERLSDRCDGWAVVEYPSGAVARDENGDLVMRMTRAEAERAAAALSKSL